MRLSRHAITGLSTLLPLALSLAIFGCSAVVPAYSEARDEWTERVDVYDQFESKIFVRATLKTEAFRRGYAEEYARIFALSPDQQAGLLDAELAEGNERYVVMAAVYTEKVSWEDLRAEHGVWSVKLISADGRHQRPLELKKRDLHNPTWRHLYPLIDFHFQLWEVHFDRNDMDGKPMGLPGEALSFVIAGAPGQAKVTWTLPGDPVAVGTATPAQP